MNFFERSLHYTKQIPHGQVTYYGYIALLAGSPRAARQVGGALALLFKGKNLSSAQEYTETDVPWWRVVNKQGYLSIRGHQSNIKQIQKQLLEKEGVHVNDKFEIVDFQQHLWTAKPQQK